MSKQFRRSQRGRRVLLWAVGAIVGVQLTSSVLLDYCWPQVRFPKLYEQVSRVESFTPAANVIFLGSSRNRMPFVQEWESTRAARELTGDAGVRCCNAAVPAGDLIISERMLRILLDHGARPRYAIIEVCPEGRQSAPRNSCLSMYVGWVLWPWDDVPAYLRDLAVTGNLVRFGGTRIIPLYVYRSEIRAQLGAYAWPWFTPPQANNATVATAA